MDDVSVFATLSMACQYIDDEYMKRSAIMIVYVNVEWYNDDCAEWAAGKSTAVIKVRHFTREQIVRYHVDALWAGRAVKIAIKSLFLFYWNGFERISSEGNCSISFFLFCFVWKVIETFSTKICNLSIVQTKTIFFLFIYKVWINQSPTLILGNRNLYVIWCRLNTSPVISRCGLGLFWAVLLASFILRAPSPRRAAPPWWMFCNKAASFLHNAAQETRSI